MPQPRKYESNAARQAAYRARKKRKEQLFSGGLGEPMRAFININSTVSNLDQAERKRP